ncbi:MAG: YkgJ family cysteine cluster protein [Lentisphaeria bacterium]
MSGQRVDCQCCGRCCRRWRVALRPGEAERLDHWRARAAPDAAAVVERYGGHPYVAHTAAGDCVFLDGVRNRCRLEEVAGAAAKPLGCRIYPFNLVTLFPGVLSCGVRFDCPAVRSNQGRELDAWRQQILDYAMALHPGGHGLDLKTLAHLEPPTVRLLADSFRTFLAESAGRLSPGAQTVVLWRAVQRFAGLGPAFVNDRETMAEILPRMLAKFAPDPAEERRGVPGAVSRALFRLWLANYWRRDQEWSGSRGAGARLRRAWLLVCLMAGHGSPAGLSSEHPDLALGRAGLFRLEPPVQPLPGPAASDAAEVWECWRRWLGGRLETWQWFGAAGYGQDLWGGLRSLLQAGLLVAATARVSAAAAGRPRLAAADVQYAVGAIDHAFGRSPLLQWAPMRRFDAWFAGPRFEQLVAALDWQ